MRTAVACRTLRPVIRWHAFEQSPMPSLVAGHVASCLRCQAVEVSARATLRRLRTDPPTVPVGADAVHRGVPGWVPVTAIAVTAAVAVAGVRRIRSA